jgi:hypothetical protein
MNPRRSEIVRNALALLAFLALVAGQAVAGPPLICHPFDIGEAKSLPWISHDWNLTGQEGYDTRNLAGDTLAILDSTNVTLVHMETLRRATLYARKDPSAGKQLLAKLVSRAEASQNSARPNALAIFDAGYLAETYQQWLGEGGQNPAHGLDGTAQVKKALTLRPDDAQMEFAAALVGLKAPPSEEQEHVQKAIAGSKADPLLARNLSTHFLGANSPTMAEMIARNTKVAKQ